MDNKCFGSTEADPFKPKLNITHLDPLHNSLDLPIFHLYV